VPACSDELKLEVDDVIEVLSEVEEGWWKGKLGDKVSVMNINVILLYTGWTWSSSGVPETKYIVGMHRSVNTFRSKLSLINNISSQGWIQVLWVLKLLQYKSRVGSEYLFTMRKEVKTNYKFKKKKLTNTTNITKSRTIT
jgi:hypothetical protein